MVSNPLARKLQIKTGQKILLVNAPVAFQMLLDPLPDDAIISIDLLGNHDNVLLFVTSSNELINLLQDVHKLLRPSTIFWIAYPKKSSSLKFDLDMMSSRVQPEIYGLRPVSSASIDETWTALRFKPVDQVKKSGVGNDEIQSGELSEYIDIPNRVIRLPPDLKTEIELNPTSLSFFDSLSWTNQKEYVTWILTAKQEKTRLSRVKKAGEWLSLSKKNPSEK